MALLLEQDRAGGRALDHDGNHQHQRAEGDQREQGRHAIHHGLGQRRGGVGGERAFVEVDGRQTVDVADRVVEQHHAGQVGNPHHVDAGVEQIDVQAFDLLGLGQWQGDVQAADVVFVD